MRGPANGGTNVGATHSHTPENLVANHPGLKVVCPSNAYDAKGLMKAAIRDNDPVFVMENTLLYGQEWEVPEEEYIVELGVANILKEGSDMTIVSHGRCAMIALDAVKTLEEQHGISAELIDLRSIRPLDEETILESVKKTGRALLVEKTNLTAASTPRSPTSFNTKHSITSTPPSTASRPLMPRRFTPSRLKTGKSLTRNAL